MTFNIKTIKMRNIIVVCTFLGGILMTGCNKNLLDTKPDYKYTEGNFWDSESAAENALTGCYAVLRYAGVYGGDATPLWEEAASPNAYDYDNTLGFNSIAEGEQSSSTGGIISSRWLHCYQGIGRCNTFLKKVKGVSMDDDLKSRMEGEAYFLRAVFYFMLETYWGDVPLILDAPDLESQGKLPRTPREEVVQQVLKDLDLAAATLPQKYSGVDIGRATQGAALALKAKVLLFEASPLYNPDNDGQRWETAAEACEQVIAMAPEAGYALYPNYRNLFLPENENNTEVIFDVQFVYPDEGNSFDLIDRQYNTNAPLQGLLDAYEMKNGLPIDDSRSGYDPAHPYLNRDPRLYATVVYPGDTYMGGTVSADRFAITGYGLEKYSLYTGAAAASNIANLGKGQSYTNYIVLRYADILLMYAEAKNEYDPSNASIRNNVNMVRERSGMPDIPQGLSQDEMRDVIRHERRIEFAGEGYYYNDIRRWKTAEQEMNAQIKTWQNKVIETRHFNVARDYWWPVPIHQRDLNPNLDQNPNY